MEKAINPPKSLKEYTQRFLIWLWEQRLLFLFSFILLSPYLIRYLPPQESWFIWQQRIASTGLLLHSVPMILYLALGSFIDDLFGSFYFFNYPDGLFFIWDFVILYLIRRTWRRRGEGKDVTFAVLLVIGISTAFLFMVLAPFSSVGPIHSSCETYTSEIHGVRIVAYPENTILGNDHVFYLKTTDGGRNWKQVGYEVEGNPDTIDDEDCLEYLQENP
ncbi:MAG: hypothetical protein DWQ07_19805 [Chloroflexi bacterium]|nr:MAG: hypothetical protein DWQ07_19805 [Chloroflexota bacterium]MBL1194329.1 hypothetical protein [Chloroflexota bacterium]NOH11619.1 hypothetical protein [Chloroflexota bacterium]